MSVAFGAVYTRPWTANLILDLAGYRAEENLVDAVAIEPAAGDGAFLIPMIERLVSSCRRQARPLKDCVRSLTAYELDEAAAGQLRKAAGDKLIDLDVSKVEAQKLTSSWIKNGDFLLEASRHNGTSLPFEDIATDEKNTGVDFVIGNPPYIRLEEIPQNRNALYRSMFSTMRGRADIYVAFYEAALRLLKPGGVCAFICADRWMVNHYGIELRRLITSGYSVEAVIEMHNAEAFETEVDAYPAITVIRRAEQGKVLVARAGSTAREADASASAFLLRNFTKGANGAPLPEGFEGCRADGWFKGGDPWPCTSPKRLALLKHLEERFPPLESPVSETKVGIGVATGLDEVFITKDSGLVERDRLLPIAMTSDTATGTFKWSGSYLINPWTEEGLVDLKDFPQLRDYFEEHQERLEKRHVARAHKRNWFRTIDRVNLGLLKKSKLYVPDIKNTIHPVLDEGTSYPHHNLYFIISNRWDLSVLGALLMSDVGRFFVESYGVRMRGGYLRMQAQYLRRIRVPLPEQMLPAQAQALADAFHKRDVTEATRIAFEVYGIDAIPPEE